MAKNNYWVSPTADGWKAKRERVERADGVFNTQKETESFARDLMRNNGGGELITQSQCGPIRSKGSTNSLGPNPPKDH